MKRAFTEAVQHIKELIYQRSNPKAYSAEIGLRHGIMYNFLNHEKGINVKTFFKIITPLGLRMHGDEKLIEVKTVWCDGESYHKGQRYKGKDILLCFGDSSSSKQCMLLENEAKENELMVC